MEIELAEGRQGMIHIYLVVAVQNTAFALRLGDARNLGGHNFVASVAFAGPIPGVHDARVGLVVAAVDTSLVL